MALLIFGLIIALALQLWVLFAQRGRGLRYLSLADGDHPSGRRSLLWGRAARRSLSGLAVRCRPVPVARQCGPSGVHTGLGHLCCEQAPLIDGTHG